MELPLHPCLEERLNSAKMPEEVRSDCTELSVGSLIVRSCSSPPLPPVFAAEPVRVGPRPFRRAGPPLIVPGLGMTRTTPMIQRTTGGFALAITTYAALTGSAFAADDPVGQRAQVPAATDL